MGLALVSAGIYAASVTKLVDYSQTELVFTTGHLANGTFTSTPQGWSVTLTWRFENDGRLPVVIANVQIDFVVDNTSDPLPWDSPAKVATEVTKTLGFFADRFTGPVVAPGATWDEEWQFDVTAPSDVAKIAPGPDGKFYVGVLGGRVVYYIADVDNMWIAGVPPSYQGV